MSDSPDEPQRHRREVVSFTRRGGRLNDRQQRAWDAMAPHYLYEPPAAGRSTSVDPEHRVDLEALFGRRAPLVLEIGSGNGESLVRAAQEHPDWDFWALEVYVPGVAQTFMQIRSAGVTNVRISVTNAPEILRTALPEHSVHELWTWFPDPWHKTRHNKRRMITVEFTELVARVLEPEGTWRMATDWADYGEQMARVIEESPHVVGGPVERYAGRIVTKFETKGLAKGREIHDLAARPAR